MAAREREKTNTNRPPAVPFRPDISRLSFSRNPGEPLDNNALLRQTPHPTCRRHLHDERISDAGENQTRLSNYDTISPPESPGLRWKKGIGHLLSVFRQVGVISTPAAQWRKSSPLLKPRQRLALGGVTRAGGYSERL